MANYTQNDVSFTDISTSLLAIGAKVTATPYQVDEGNSITFSLPIINAIDIDWNGAVLFLKSFCKCSMMLQRLAKN